MSTKIKNLLKLFILQVWIGKWVSPGLINTYTLHGKAQRRWLWWKAVKKRSVAYPFEVGSKAYRGKNKGAVGS